MSLETILCFKARQIWLITESCDQLPLRRSARLTPVTCGDSLPPGGSLSAPSLPLEGKAPRRGGRGVRHPPSFREEPHILSYTLLSSCSSCSSFVFMQFGPCKRFLLYYFHVIISLFYAINQCDILIKYMIAQTWRNVTIGIYSNSTATFNTFFFQCTV